MALAFEKLEKETPYMQLHVAYASNQSLWSHVFLCEKQRGPPSAALRRIVQFVAFVGKFHSNVSPWGSQTLSLKSTGLVNPHLSKKERQLLRVMNGMSRHSHQVLRLPRKMTIKNLTEICNVIYNAPTMIRAWSENDPSMSPSVRNLPREHFVWKNVTFCAATMIPNFTKYCACHKKWHFDFTKYCACNEKWHLNFKKYSACH